MQGKNKYVRNLTIGAITGGLIAGGIQLALIDKKPFIRDFINTYGVTTDATIRTTEGLTRISPTSEFLASDKIDDMNEVEVKSYRQVENTYDVEVYGFTYGSLTSEEITTKQNQFENGNTLASITDFDNNDEYQVEERELPTSYKDVLEEISIKTVNYNSVIPVRESIVTNIYNTFCWSLLTAYGAGFGGLTAKLIENKIEEKKTKKLK